MLPPDQKFLGEGQKKNIAPSPLIFLKSTAEKKTGVKEFPPGYATSSFIFFKFKTTKKYVKVVRGVHMKRVDAFPRQQTVRPLLHVQFRPHTLHWPR